jgi:hypothetical protein
VSVVLFEVSRSVLAEIPTGLFRSIVSIRAICKADGGGFVNGLTGVAVAGCGESGLISTGLIFTDLIGALFGTLGCLLDVLPVPEAFKMTSSSLETLSS